MITTQHDAQAINTLLHWLLPSTIGYPRFQTIPDQAQVQKALEHLADLSGTKMGCGMSRAAVQTAFAVDGERIAAIESFNTQRRRSVS